MPDTILVCDDEELIRWSLCEHLAKEGYDAVAVDNGQACLDAVAERAPAGVLLDVKMPGIDGLTVLARLREAGNDVPVIVMTAHGGVATAIEATRLGADGYLGKPFDLREATIALARAIAAHKLKHEVLYHRARERSAYGEIIGSSPAMQKLYETLRRVEGVDGPTILIQGESGTGKDLVARTIHARGPRRAQPYVEIDCTALPEALMESELFGHERGAFTDAKTSKRGLFEVADKGVVFLDEVGELPLGMQAKLLRAMENRKFRRVGGTADIPLNAAILAATNRRLKDEVQAGRFREDLYFRLHVLPIEVPPLRHRLQDLDLLVHHFVDRYNRLFGRQVQGISAEAMEILRAYRWPGNVRELRNVIERTVILLQGDVIQTGDLPADVRRTTPADADEPTIVLPPEGIVLAEVERSLVRQALARTQGNQTSAARLLGLTRFALRTRIEKFRLTA